MNIAQALNMSRYSCNKIIIIIITTIIIIIIFIIVTNVILLDLLFAQFVHCAQQLPILSFFNMSYNLRITKGETNNFLINFYFWLQ